MCRKGKGVGEGIPICLPPVIALSRCISLILRGERWLRGTNGRFIMSRNVNNGRYIQRLKELTGRRHIGMEERGAENLRCIEVRFTRFFLSGCGKWDGEAERQERCEGEVGEAILWPDPKESPRIGKWGEYKKRKEIFRGDAILVLLRYAQSTIPPSIPMLAEGH
jgi:hypothetical protein